MNLNSKTFKCTKKGPITIVTNIAGRNKIMKTKAREKRYRTRIENYLSKVNKRTVLKYNLTAKNKEKLRFSQTRQN